MAKSLIDKLNLKKYPAKLILDKPQDINEFDAIDYDETIKNSSYDLIFQFIFHLEDFPKNIKKVHEQGLLNENGYLYFAYPKKNNPKYEEYIERDSIYTDEFYNEEGYLRGTNLKFSRMVSMNDVFTVIGIKAIPLKKMNKPTTKSSQCVDDYIGHVEDIKQNLSKNPEVLDIYNELTFGYQKDWARYVFSAKRKETQEKRLLGMETVLAEGYKTMDLYRRNKK